MIWADSPVFHPAPFGLPPESMEIILDIPAPPSTNRIWRHKRNGLGKLSVYNSKEYEAWKKEAGRTILANRQYPKENKIIGPFEISVQLARSSHGDLDNFLKALLDFLQPSRKSGDNRIGIIADDKDCQKVWMEWVPTASAPLGCHVVLRSLHE